MARAHPHTFRAAKSGDLSREHPEEAEEKEPIEGKSEI